MRYVGTVEGKRGEWVGVEYDEPVGKHSGTVEGHQYFVARPSCGAFVRGDLVEIGAFSAVDPFADEDMLDEL